MNDQIIRLNIPNGAEMARSASAALSIAKEWTINDAEDYDMAADELKAIKSKAKALEDRRKEITKPLDASKKSVMDLFREPLELLAQAESVIKRAMLTWQQEQERIRRAEQARLEAEAKAERERLAKEAAAREAEARAKAAEAERLASAGDAIAAAELAESAQQALFEADVQRETAALVTAPVAKVAEAKAAGVSTRETWKAEVTDKAALIAHVAANPQFSGLLTVDQSALNALARSLKSSLTLPGVRVYAEQTLAARASA